MLSRSPSIHRTPGESPSRRPAPVRPPTERGVADAVLKGRVWRRTLLLVVLAGMLVSLLLSNTNGVVDTIMSALPSSSTAFIVGNGASITV